MWEMNQGKTNKKAFEYRKTSIWYVNTHSSVVLGVWFEKEISSMYGSDMYYYIE